jgi:xylulokinase
MAISASAREAFPVDADGRALGPCMMAGDTRASERWMKLLSETCSPEQWIRSCSHLPERMDPVCRLLWWRENRPEIMARARYFWGWHEFLTFRMTGRAVTDPGLAARWLVYDLDSRDWSPQRLAQFGVAPAMLPTIQTWGTVAGTVAPSPAAELGLPTHLKIGMGTLDAACSALGAGVVSPGTAALVSGSWEDLVVPVNSSLPVDVLLRTNLTGGPHPGPGGTVMYSLSPNGTAVVDWARNLLGISLESLDADLQASDLGPSPVLAVPHLSGTMLLRERAGRTGGALLGLTLASSKTELMKALMEGIAYDLCQAAAVMRASGVSIGCLRAVGGGARLAWWTQLKSDLLMTPIELVNQPQPGTLGAALLGGLAVGAFSSLEQAAREFVKVERRFEPDTQRAGLHAERLAAYKAAVGELLRLNWSGPVGASG